MPSDDKLVVRQVVTSLRFRTVWNRKLWKVVIIQNILENIADFLWQAFPITPDQHVLIPSD